jgi:putative addiction module killer protein
MLEVIYTETFLEWLKRLRDRNGRQVIVARLKRAAEGNLGDIASVGDGLSEFRIHYGPGYRVYFVRRGHKVIVLLNAGDKSTQERDILRAKLMAEELDGPEWH